MSPFQPTENLSIRNDRLKERFAVGAHRIQLAELAFWLCHFGAAFARVCEKKVVDGTEALAGQRDELFNGEVGRISNGPFLSG